MKRISAAILLLAIAGTLFAQKVPLLTGDWDPYTSQRMAGNGAVTEIITAALKEAKVDISVTFVPWKRCESEVVAGTAFATFPYMTTPERAAIYDFSDVLMTSRGKIFYWDGRGKDVAWTTYKDFGDVAWGGYPGNWYEAEFQKQGIKYDPAPSLDLAIKMLQAGRVSYIIEDELVFMVRAKELLGADISKVKSVTKINNETGLRLMVSKKYPGAPALLKKFNEGLAAIKANGTYAAILAKYGLKD